MNKPKKKSPIIKRKNVKIILLLYDLICDAEYNYSEEYRDSNLELVRYKEKMLECEEMRHFLESLFTDIAFPSLKNWEEYYESNESPER